MLPRNVLQFSGGKDSLACLYLLEKYWPDLTVVWVNTGAAFPETLEQMERTKELVPHFLEVRGRQTIEQEGFPVDVLPIASTRFAQQFEGNAKRIFQSRYTCCAAALWQPMYQAMQQLDAQVIYRGQKKCDAKRVPMLSGTIVDGVRYEFPIEDWSDADVRQFLRRRGVPIPKNYGLMSTGLDCWNCTAYLSENRGKLEYMRRHYPSMHAVVAAVLADLKEAIDEDAPRAHEQSTGVNPHVG